MMNPDKLFEKLKDTTKESPFNEKEIKRLINKKSLINKRNTIMGTTLVTGLIVIITLFSGNKKPDDYNNYSLNISSRASLQEKENKATNDFINEEKIDTQNENILNSNILDSEPNIMTDTTAKQNKDKLILASSQKNKEFKNPYKKGNYKNMGDIIEVFTKDNGENISPFNFGEVDEARSFTLGGTNNTSDNRYELKPVYGKKISKLKMPTLSAEHLDEIGIKVTDSSFIWAKSYKTQINKFEYKRDKRYRRSRQVRLLEDAGYPIGDKITVKENLEMLFNPYFEEMMKKKKGGYTLKETIDRMIYRDFDYRKHAKAYKVEYGTEDSRLEPVFVEYQISDQFGYLLGDNGQNYSFGTPLEDILSDYNYKLVPIKYDGSNFGKLKDITFWFSPSEELLAKLPRDISSLIKQELNNNCQDVNSSILQSCNNNPNISDFKLYPNPAYNILKLNLEASNVINCEINIFDLPGNQVATLGKHQISGDIEMEFVINKLKPGLYTLNIESDQGDYLNLKFIKR